ncbi:hypothetical protein ONS95_014470 [Cadophora gregata]|uniref:uncharacterized protein n=1 Tax=Cadophora gregata TaxID=51156 RepID=UPI0026DABE58|nr:uncharacterized protein ONS95_014470 [Cadophora gregata]KAK0112735.1 hypothetical protein ONS95_014470 [Cadophora gregata]KAK0124870.1 hypothetical protein ONS96_008748 [Cadophora gregata f. sp. sojae]
MYTNANRGMWTLGGSQWILIDQPNDPDTLGNDFMTQDFLRNQPGCKIPLLKEMRCISQPTDKTNFILMSRAQGVTLQSIWEELSSDQKLSYSKQVADVIKELRTYTSPVPQKVDGTPLDDFIIGFCYPMVPHCKKIGSTGKTWIDNLAEELRHGLAIEHDTNDPAIIDEKFRDLRENFPNQEPYVLSHLDLHASNIMVKDGKIEAILDWEYAGYYPWWVERYRSYAAGDDVKDELFEPIWANETSLNVEMDRSEWDAYTNKIGEVIGLYSRCPREHPEYDGCWQRPAFCECRPFGGFIRLEHLGGPTGHRIAGKSLTTEGGTNLNESEEEGLRS